jgi:hypothetical protein
MPYSTLPTVAAGDAIKAVSWGNQVRTNQEDHESRLDLLEGVLRYGNGTPEGSITGVVGDVYLRRDGSAGTIVYVKESGSGNTGWVAYSSGGGSGSVHNLLSATHSDVTAATVVRGDVITGQGASPTWKRLALGAAGTILKSDGTDIAWASDGSTLTDLNASNITSGTVAPARLGSGTPSASMVLRGDSTWAASTVSAHNLLSATHSDTTTATAVRGDLIVSPSGGGWARFAVGSANGVLTTDGTDPAWSTTPRLVRLGLGVAADASAALKIDGQYGSTTEDAGNSSTALTINWDNGNTQLVTLTGNCTFTLSNPKDGFRYLLVLKQDGTGSRTVTWPSSVKWQGGTAPTLSTTAGKVDVVTLVWIAGIGASGNYLAAANTDYTPA